MHTVASTALVVLTLSTGLLGVARAQCSGAQESFPAGIADEFTLPAEPTAPSSAYLNYMTNFWPQPVTRQFDDTGTDVALIHSFQGWQGSVCGAHLEIRLAAGSSSLTSNDSIRLSWNGGPPDQAFDYWSTIANVIGTYPDDWQPGDVATLDLDLQDLPVTGNGSPTDILTQLADGSLELAVEDDSAVDYAVLYVCHCPVSVEDTTWGRVKSGYSNRIR